MIYIKDLRKASKLTQLLLFAAETGIFYFHSASNCLESVLNDELQNFDVCLKCNKLYVNIKNKTKQTAKQARKQKITHIVFKLR